MKTVPDNVNIISVFAFITNINKKRRKEERKVRKEKMCNILGKYIIM